MKKFGLTGRITGLLILIAVVSSCLVGAATLLIIKQQFTEYVDAYSRSIAREWGDAIAVYYQEYHTLEGIQAVIVAGQILESGFGPRGREGRPMSGTQNRRIIVSDTSNIVVGDTAGEMIGQQLKPGQIPASAYQLEYNGKRVGTLYVISPLHLGISSLENRFISKITGTVEIVVALVILLAAVVGILLTRHILSPLSALSVAIREVATGNLKARVTPKGDRELAELGQHFNTMAEKLDENEETRRRMMADIAHELRTPLSLLRGELEAIQSQRVEADETTVSNLVDEVIRLSRLVADLESLSLAESRSLVLHLERIPMGALIDRLQPLSLAMEEAGIRFVVKRNPDVDEVEADPVRLLQILINLISNAIKHTPPGGEITLAIRRDSRGAVVFSVADTGPGIAPEHLPHVFDRFYRVDESRNREAGGAGLGLAIARGFTQAHGGDISVESEQGQGTVFTFTIPQPS